TRTLTGANLLLGCHVPDGKRLGPGRDQSPAVGAEGHGCYPVRVAQRVQLPPAPRVPELDGPICARRSQATPIGGMERHARDRPVMAPEGDELLARLRLDAGSIPYPDGLVQARGDQSVAVRTEGHAEDMVQVAPEREDFATGGGVPELDGLIDTS